MACRKHLKNWDYCKTKNPYKEWISRPCMGSFLFSKRSEKVARKECLLIDILHS